MNDHNLILLQKNDLFNTLVPKISSSLNNLSRDISNFGTFLDDNNDIGIGKFYIKKNKIIEEYLEDMDYSNNSVKEDDSKTNENQIKLVSKVKTLLYPIQKDLTEIIQNEGYSLELLDIHNYKYGDNLFYIILISLYPNYHNFTNEEKRNKLNTFCNELSFNLLDRGTLKQYNYKGIISENSLQNTLLDEKERILLSYSTISSFLSDFFHINIVVIINKLVIETLHHDPERLTLILFYKKGKYSIGTNNFLANLFPPCTIKKIYEELEDLLVINKIQSCSKYKIKDIQEIALKLDIDIDHTVNGKSKKKTKNNLYDEILKLIPR